MPRILLTVLALMAVTLASSCDKDSDSSDEAILYGMWTKGSGTGDTLYFYKKNGQNWLKMNQSFNPGLYAPVETIFKMEDGKLHILYGGAGFNYWPIHSFTWKTPGRSFEIEGHQLYMFMSATLIKFTFHKVQ